jgi:hypothetical protein
MKLPRKLFDAAMYFTYQIVIGDDSSVGKSRVVILNYVEKYPYKFKLFLHEKNVGAAENQRVIFENWIGGHVAM